ncbi:hypothetical protein NQ317_003491 [Molorchus minor]|uniref:dolichyl-phosphate beta-glucosyltransferase n=1 Tax=Molorchus minor TaxID=1323400 RepID=A0ABQ9J1B7_9CUCU|nr:hypothetical protein NQ317_003491 [Molorchus minor]
MQLIGLEPALDISHSTAKMTVLNWSEGEILGYWQSLPGLRFLNHTNRIRIEKTQIQIEETHKQERNRTTDPYTKKFENRTPGMDHSKRDKNLDLIGLFTGHGSLKYHMHEFGLVENSESHLCLDNDETKDLILCICPAVVEKNLTQPALGMSVILTLCIFLIATSKIYPVVFRSKKEKCFIDPITGNVIEFPSLDEKFSIHLSVIVPAYNEEDRLPPMLDECISFLEERCTDSSFKYEIIVVSDGSTDGTVKVAHEYAKRMGPEKFRVLELETNRGKGGAVRLGMQSARGALLLFADADGATKFSDLTKVEAALGNLTKCNYFKELSSMVGKVAISIGSRAHLEEDAVASRSFFRTILMFGFHFLVWLFAVKGIRDTQCGFKLMTRDAARLCFESMHVERWAFDVELLYIAQTLNIPIAEVAVTWTEVEGSKITPVWSWIQMGIDLGLIWMRYTIGAWKIKSIKKE